MICYPVFGYEIYEVCHFDMFSIYPVLTDRAEIRSKSGDEDVFHATGMIVGHEISREQLFHLPFVLSFINGRGVRIGGQIEKETLEAAKVFLSGEAFELERPSGGAILRADVHFTSIARPNLIRLALEALVDTSRPESNEFQVCFHKYVLSFSGGAAKYVDVSYYLLFSGLEALARKCLNDCSPNTASVLCKFLCSLGFSVKQEDGKDLFRSMQAYSKLRNALFHNGVYEASHPIGQTVFLNAHIQRLSQLVKLVILRQIHFNHVSIYWDLWPDLGAFT